LLQASFFKLMMDARTRVVAYLVVLSLLAYQFSILFWQLYPDPNSPLTRSSTAVQHKIQVGAQQPSRLEQAEKINRAYLFGKAVVQEAVTEVVEDAPETRLNYKLRGIYFSGEPELAAAIVELKPNSSFYFKIGDELAENILVSAIAQDHILIDRYGKIERLNIEKPAVSASNAALRTSSATNSTQSSNLLRSYKKRYISNPLALAKRFQAIPVQENGKNIGFRLKALRGESLLKRLNFNENDVFTQINGISLDKPFQALDALKSLTTASSISVTILRNGNEETMEFSM